MKEIEIPEGYEARIDGNKVIIQPIDSEDERIRKFLVKYFKFYQSHPDLTLDVNTWQGEKVSNILAYLEKQKEQKHAEQLDGTFTSYDMAKTFMEGQNYVLAHPEKFGLCKPAEWSEEDNINLNACIQIINDTWEKAQIKELGTTKFAPHYYGDLIDWLKSLQSHWKPSKKQMEALEDAFRKDGGNEYRKVINSLYCDLQKLL